MKKYFLLFLFIFIIFSGCSNNSIKEKIYNDGITIHFKKPLNWPHEVYIYYYKDEEISVGLWPGIQMEYEKHDWYVYTIKENWYKESKVMFFGDDEHRNPGHLEPGFPVWDILQSKEIWFYNKKWYSRNPE